MPADVEDLLRALAPQVLGVLTRRYRDFDAAEDAVQEALLAAAVHWPKDGIPQQPRGWLIQTATRRLIDQRRNERSRRRARTGRCGRSRRPRTSQDADDTLVVLFLCCHPSLTPASAIALTLRAVGGLTRRRSRARSWFPRRRWPSGSAGEAADQDLRRPVPAADAGGAAARCGRSCTSST